MSATKLAGPASDRHARVIHVSPITRAVRHALAVSATALALAGPAAAASPCAPASTCAPARASAMLPLLAQAPVVDLTIVRAASVGPQALTATGPGDVAVDNHDPISIGDLGDVAAISGYAPNGNLTIANDAQLDATSVFGSATGISGIAAGDASVDNSGPVEAYSVFGDALGLDVRGGDVVRVSNSSSGSILATSIYGLADGIFATGRDVGVTNAGDITALGYTWAAGIEAQGDEVTVVDNSGTIVADAYAVAEGGPYGTAFGILATGGAGGVTVTNTGSITATGVYATGIDASSAGLLSITNGGDIVAGFGSDMAAAEGNYYATGIRASTNYDGGDIAIVNTGSIAAGGIIGATGIDVAATGLGSQVSLDNSGDITVVALHPYGYADGIIASGDSDTSVSTSGTIIAASYGSASGVSSLSFAGTADLTNTGDVYIQAGAGGQGIGLIAGAQNGAANVSNDGLVQVDSGLYVFGAQVDGLTGAIFANTGTVQTTGTYSYGVLVTSGQGDAVVDNGVDAVIDSYGELFGLGTAGIATLGDAVGTNAGTINVFGGAQALAAYERSREGDARFDNSGDITAVSYGAAVAVTGLADLGNVQIGNDGQVMAIALDQATGINANADYGVASVTNAGAVGAYSYYGTAVAIQGTGATVDIGNAGTAQATSYYNAAFGIVGVGGDVTIANDGGIEVAGTVSGTGIYAVGQNATVTSAGDITVAATDALGAYVYGAVAASLTSGGALSVSGDASATGGVLFASGTGSVLNTGDLQVTSLTGVATGVLAGAGQLAIENRGSILATGAEAIGVDLLSAGTLLNSGTLRAVQGGAQGLAVRGGDSVQDVRNAGTIDGALDLGGGADQFTNMAGGVWNITSDATDFGDGDDVLRNMSGATIVLNDGSLSLGSSTAGNAFINAGLVRIDGIGIVDMGRNADATGANALAFTNTGVLGLDDGATDDQFEIIGDLGGQGRLAIDLDIANGSADQLLVDGNIASGGVQAVDVRFEQLPTGSTTPVEFARVSGTSTDGAFVGGTVLGYGTGNFLDLNVNVTSQITAAGDDVFSVGLELAGLSDSGQLAASAAPGMLRLVDAQVGTWRERMGLNPELGDERVGLGPWIRSFADHGNMRATQIAGNFDQGGALEYRQANHGTEVGFDAHLGGGVHAGVLMGKSFGTQRTTGGTNRLEGDTTGLYASWFSADGIYVDASYRWMEFGVDLLSAGTMQRTRGDAGAFNVEAGWTAWHMGQVALTPQLQYTQAHVGNIDVVQGPESDFAIGNSESRRARLGVEASASFENGAVRWTPYAAVSAVREFDGESSYAVSDAFFATTSTKGTSAKVDLGAGAQFGGVSLAGGVNWTDGGAMRDVVGGQLVLRYTW